MESWEILREAAERIGVKAVAAKLNLSTALIYKWCQEPRAHDPDASGALNPLDRLKTLYEATREPRLINWVCNVADGFFVPNPHSPPGVRDEQLLGVTQQVVQDFGELLSDISRSIENDGIITAVEAESVRQAWEKLKSHTECFVVACERGVYGQAGRR
jgi:hypothetical protein